MQVSPSQKKLIEQVINCFETGSITGNYSQVTLLDDAPNGTKQVTYGRSQVTEYGNLKTLLQAYHGQYAMDLGQYIPKIRDGSLATNTGFHELLRKAGKDPAMQKCQDDIFDEHYFKPSVEWATTMGFTEALSLLVIYDSYIHSGHIMQSLRNKFSERVPNEGGNEKTWIKSYVEARHNWFKNSLNPVLQNCVYRTSCLMSLISLGNWDLTQRPIMAHGVMIR